MRLALLLKYRHRLPMQLDRGSSFLSSSSTRPPYSQQATQPRVQPVPPPPPPPPPPRLPRSSPTPRPTSPPAKLKRAAADSSSAFSSARRGSQSSSKSSPGGKGKNSPKKGPVYQDASSSTQKQRNQPHRKQGSLSRTSSLKRKRGVPKNQLDGPFHDKDHILKEYLKSGKELKDDYKVFPKSPLHNFYAIVKDGQTPTYETVLGTYVRDDEYLSVWRTNVKIDIQPPIIGVGDHAEKRESIHLAALSALYQLHALDLLENARCLVPLKPPPPPAEATLSDGSVVNFERARSFMDYYCRRYGFKRPEIDLTTDPGGSRWDAVMTVGERRIGVGSGTTKKQAQVHCYLDVTRYLESCDPKLWEGFVEAARTGKDLGLAPKVNFDASHFIATSIEDLCHDIRRSGLYRNRPIKNVAHLLSGTGFEAGSSSSHVSAGAPRLPSRHMQTSFAIKSKRLEDRRKEYLEDQNMEKMRKTRAALPVYSQAKQVLDHIAKHEVTICIAATGSGKTTQIPQLILDDYIDRGEGASCNIICTQPRRLAAISVAHRVAKERGEQIGKSIGYQVRFEAKLPEPNGSVMFCTTGVFLKRLQTILARNDRRGQSEFEHISHIIVDEVHERDVDTDLLLVVLKQLMALKKAKKQSLKIVLMSATIDPTLFTEYFADEGGVPADKIIIPGRSYPVTKHFMDDFTEKILSGPMEWVKHQESVARYIAKELGHLAAIQMGVRLTTGVTETKDDLDLPYPFVAAMISHVLQSSKDGHVLVFLPGWEEIVATQKALMNPFGPLGINFSSPKYSLHLLHSSIPLAEQQAIFDPPEPGIRRVILATNIAETSVTIPDVVYVIDTAKIKEQKYDPDRHMSSLVSSWVGTSNLNQRAGRAGRHRSGEYYGILGKARAEKLQTHQTVEMKRTDLSNVVMHVKALNLPGMTVEEVLAAAIEPPEDGRVEAAIKNLQMVGALDSEKNLTALGKVLLQLPVDAQVGKMVLYGSFFRCLDPALTLAALLTNREPFLSPMHVREKAQSVKSSWSPQNFRSDVFAALNAYDKWWSMQSRGEFTSANRFCQDNFLSKPTLLLIQKVRGHLLQALYRAGVIDVSAGGEFGRNAFDMQQTMKNLTVPDALNMYKDSMPLLTALVSIAAQPKFAIQRDKGFRTATDKFAMIHPSSVNRKRELADQAEEKDKDRQEKRLYVYGEKRRNDTVGSSAATFLVATTRIDPLVYILFGAYNVKVVQGGLECDDWLPITGDSRDDSCTLDDIWCLKTSMEASMLRVFEGITLRRQRKGEKLHVLPRESEDECEWESGDEDEERMRYYSLSREEMRDLDNMTSSLVTLLNSYSTEKIGEAQSVQNSRAATPISRSPYSYTSRLPGSGYSTPYYQSRPGTPSQLKR